MVVIRVRWAASEEQGEAITRMFSTQRAATPALAPVAPWLPPTLPYLFAQLPPPLLCSLVLSPPAVPEAASPAGIPSLRSGCLPSAELRVTARRLLTCHYPHCLWGGGEPHLSGRHCDRSTFRRIPRGGRGWCWENPQARRPHITCLSSFPSPLFFSFQFDLNNVSSENPPVTPKLILKMLFIKTNVCRRKSGEAGGGYNLFSSFGRGPPCCQSPGSALGCPLGGSGGFLASSGAAQAQPPVRVCLHLASNPRLWRRPRALGFARGGYSLFRGSEVCHLTPWALPARGCGPPSCVKLFQEQRVDSRKRERSELDLKRKGAGAGMGAGVRSPRPAGWCLGVPTWTPAARRLWDKKPSKCTCSLFLCERRSQGCNICVPCSRRNSDFLKPAKCP